MYRAYASIPSRHWRSTSLSPLRGLVELFKPADIVSRGYELKVLLRVPTVAKVAGSPTRDKATWRTERAAMTRSGSACLESSGSVRLVFVATI